MYKQERRQAMLSYLEDNDVLALDEAIHMFDSSPATMRRDFSFLINSGMVKRGVNSLRRMDTHAGIDRPIALRDIKYPREKDAIAKRAAELPKDKEVIFLDGGTTTQHMVKHLPAFGFRIITSCVRIAAMLAARQLGNPEFEIIMPGGTLSQQSYVLYGAQTCRALDGYRAHWAFIGVDGIDGDTFYSVNESISETQAAMIRNSDVTVLLADHSKFLRHSMVRTAKLDKQFIVITDEWPENQEVIDSLRANEVTVTTVRKTHVL